MEPCDQYISISAEVYLSPPYRIRNEDVEPRSRVHTFSYAVMIERGVERFEQIWRTRRSRRNTTRPSTLGCRSCTCKQDDRAAAADMHCLRNTNKCNVAPRPSSLTTTWISCFCLPRHVSPGIYPLYNPIPQGEEPSCNSGSPCIQANHPMEHQLIIHDNTKARRDTTRHDTTHSSSN